MGRLQVVQLALDELEALRLCDLLGLDQETAGERMGVSRGTVQRLLSSAGRCAGEREGPGDRAHPLRPVLPWSGTPPPPRPPAVRPRRDPRAAARPPWPSTGF